MAKQKLGDCYEVHGRHIIDALLEKTPMLPDMKLCHGTVWHPVVGWHGHCWIEMGNDVVTDFSNGHNWVGRREQYYAKGKIKNVTKYTPEQVREKVLETGHWGDWK